MLPKSEAQQSTASPTIDAGFNPRDLIKYDLPASLVVFLVAVPLSLGIAVASGAPISGGLTAAIVGGIVAGFLGSSRLQVSGPAAGLVVVVTGVISEHGWAMMCAVAFCAGFVQILLGLSRVARMALGISPAVVHGMLAGIGVTIVLGQLHVILGFKPRSSPIANVQALPADIASDHVWETIVGAATIAILLVWPRLPEEVRRIPGQLVAIVGVTVAATALQLPVTRVEMPANPIQLDFAPQFPDSGWMTFVTAVVTVALIASVESLLSAVAVDKMASGQPANLSRELVGQGAANMASGALGGLPVTGVIVRSSTNVMAGAKSKASAILHGVWVLLFAVLLGGLIENIPLAALAGLLVHVGIKLMDVAHIRTASRHGDLIVYVATLGGVVVTDLMKGVIIGILVAVFMTLRRIMWSNVHAEQQGDDWRVVVEGALSFLSTPRLSAVLGKVPAGKIVRLELIVDYMDHSAFEAITDWRHTYEQSGGTVIIDEIGHPWLRAGLEGRPTVDRKHATASAPRWHAPWSDWQSPHHDDHEASPVDANPSLQRGVEQYRKHVAPLIQPTLDQLSAGQAPRTLMITCADSRIVPNLITTSGPGDLFVIRNIANLVPNAHDSEPSQSVGAAIEYAVSVLGVEDIVVCGHSMCGGMKALHDGPPSEYRHLVSWLEHAKSSLLRRDTQPAPVLHPSAGTSWDDPADVLSQHNVLQQLHNLRSYPSVHEAEQAGTLKLVGMFFDIPTAGVYMLEDQTITARAPEGSQLAPT